MMKFLTLELIKEHLRIDGEFEDSLLEFFGESAEDTLFKTIGVTYEQFIDEVGEMPKSLVNAALMLVDVRYQYRGPGDKMPLSIIPYGFDILVKPYVKL